MASAWATCSPGRRSSRWRGLTAEPASSWTQRAPAGRANCGMLSTVKDTDHAPLIAIVMMAARADGRVDSAEQQAVDAVVARIGNPDVTGLAQQVAAGQLRLSDLASRLSDDEARRAAYEGALAIVNADGSANASEQ